MTPTELRSSAQSAGSLQAGVIQRKEARIPWPQKRCALRTPVLDSVGQAHRSLVRNPTRTGLTVLGLAIGVAAFIAMVAFGDGARSSVVDQFKKLGVNVMAIRPSGQRADGTPARRATVAEVAALRREATTVQYFVPMFNGAFLVGFGGKRVSVPFRGTVPEYVALRGWKMEVGGNFDQDDVATRNTVCVLGAGTRDALFGVGVDAVGSVIELQAKFRCRIVGIVAAVGKASSGRDLDSFVLLPYSTYQTNLASRFSTFDAVDLRPLPGVRRQDVKTELTSILRRLHDLKTGEENDFKISSRDDAIEVADSIAGILTGLLASIAGVSLLVGGIGIMNIMLVSVTERTQEIGIRAAVGAQPAQILEQFLMESMALALVGTLVGIGAGTGLAVGVSNAMKWESGIPWIAIVIASVFGLGTGVLFGYLPARRAAALDPIQALRRE